MSHRSSALLQVDSMALEDPGGSSHRVQGVVAALNELERFHSGEAALQTAHYLTLIRCSGCQVKAMLWVTSWVTCLGLGWRGGTRGAETLSG